MRNVWCFQSAICRSLRMRRKLVNEVTT